MVGFDRMNYEYIENAVLEIVDTVLTFGAYLLGIGAIFCVWLLFSSLAR